MLRLSNILNLRFATSCVRQPFALERAGTLLRLFSLLNAFGACVGAFALLVLLSLIVPILLASPLSLALPLAFASVLSLALPFAQALFISLASLFSLALLAALAMLGSFALLSP